MGSKYETVINMTSRSLKMSCRNLDSGGTARGWKWLAGIAAVLFLPALACVIQIAGTPDDAAFWQTLGDYFGSIGPLAGSLAVLGALWALLWGITGRPRVSAGALILFGLLLGLANAGKISVLDLPLMPLDIYSVRDLTAVFQWDYITPGGAGKMAVLAPALMMAVMSAAFLSARESAAGRDPNGEARQGHVARLGRFARSLIGPGRLLPRLAIGGAAVGLLASLFQPATNAFARCPQTFVRCDWDALGTFRHNGLVVFLALHCRFISVEPPPGYGEEAVRGIIANLPPRPAGPEANFRPNVIMVLSESFFDATRLPGVAFDTDPLPTFRALDRQFGRLDLISPVFAGLTCNAELEVLSGLNMSFFPPGTGAYVDHIRRPLVTLASLLRDRGYSTMSVHSDGGIHLAAQVQPLLGFQRFVPEREWRSICRVGWQITDESATEELIRRVRQASRPFFICLNTMEGHVPYGQDKYGGASCGIRFTRNVSRRTAEVLTAYTYGLSRADAALGRLVETFANEKDPLLIVFYGDHLPDLGENLLAYRETGYCPPGRASECLAMRTVPCVIWNNYGARLPESAGPVSMSRMFPVLLDLAGVPKPPHARLVEKALDRWPVISTAGCFDAAGQPLSPEAAGREPLLNDYRLMQYDLFFGERHFLRAAPSAATQPGPRRDQ
jgi:hypothetical protein